jgi:hypothetical protein
MVVCRGIVVTPLLSIQESVRISGDRVAHMTENSHSFLSSVQGNANVERGPLSPLTPQSHNS